MKKVLLILLFGISFLSAEINEYVSDVYFANGIDTSYSQAKKSRDDLNISTMIKYPEAYKSVNDWKISYNTTHDIDLYESMLQKIYKEEVFGLFSQAKKPKSHQSNSTQKSTKCKIIFKEAIVHHNSSWYLDLA